MTLAGCNSCKYKAHENFVYSKNNQLSQNNGDMRLLMDAKGFWKMYFNGDLDFKKTMLLPEIMSGKGSVVAAVTDKNELDLLISYSADMNDVDVYNKTKDTDCLREFDLFSIFELKNNKASKFIVLGKGSKITTYTKKGNDWYKNNSDVTEFESYFNLGNINEKEVLGKKVSESCVQRYLDLSDKLRKEYFHGIR